MGYYSEFYTRGLRKYLYTSVFVVNAFLLVGCWPSHCKTLSCTNLSSNDIEEMNTLGVTLSDQLRQFEYEIQDGLGVLDNRIVFEFMPVQGTEDVELQFERFPHIDFEVSKRSNIVFADRNGVRLDDSVYPSCWIPSFVYGQNTVVANAEEFYVPAGMNFILQSHLSCIPAAATRIIHEYMQPDGSRDVIFDVELNSLWNWRNKVVPVICENQAC